MKKNKNAHPVNIFFRVFILGLIVVTLAYIAYALFLHEKNIKPPVVKENKQVANDKVELVYIKNGQFYIKPYNSKSQRISNKIFIEEATEQAIMQSDTDNNWTGLFYKMSNDGKTIYFIDQFDENKLSGNLNMYRIGDNVKKIAEGVSLSFSISQNGNSVLYAANTEASKDKTIYLWSKGNKLQKIDTGSVSPLNVGSDKISYLKFKQERKDKIFDLYIKSGSEEVKCIAENSIDVSYNAEENSFFVVSDYNDKKKVGNLYYIDKNYNKVKVDSSVSKLSIKASLKNVTSPCIYYLKNFDEKNEVADLYCSSSKMSPVKVSTQVLYNYIQSSKDDSTLLYFKNNTSSGNKHTFEILTWTLGKEKSIDKNAILGNNNLYSDGKKIVYLTPGNDTGKMDMIYYNVDSGKKSKLDSSAVDYKFTNQGNSIIYTLEQQDRLKNMMYSSDIIGEKQKLSDSVYKFYISGNNDLFYLADYNLDSDTGDLYSKKENEKSKKIDANVSLVIFPEE